MPNPEAVLARRRRDALGLLDASDQWEFFRGPTGHWLWRIPGSRGEKYTVDPRSCTCPDFTAARGGRVPGLCKHQIAVEIFTTQARRFLRLVVPHIEEWSAQYERSVR
jgi:hypothetical protein